MVNYVDYSEALERLWILLGSTSSTSLAGPVPPYADNLIEAELRKQSGDVV